MENSVIDEKYFIENWRTQIKLNVRRYSNGQIYAQYLYNCPIKGAMIGHMIQLDPKYRPHWHEDFEILCDNAGEVFFGCFFSPTKNPFYDLMYTHTFQAVKEHLFASPDSIWDGFRYFGPQGEPHQAATHPRFLESPAIQYQSPDYPARFEGRVPLLGVALKDIKPDPGLEIVFNMEKLCVPAGNLFVCWTNSHGAVCAILPNGEEIGVRPDEFEVVEYFSGQREDLLG